MLPGEPWHTRHMVREALMLADLIDEKRMTERREVTNAPQGAPNTARFWSAERAAKRRRLIAEQRGNPGEYLHG